MPSRPGVTVGLALGLPLILIFSLLVFLVLTEPEDCLPADLPGVDVPAEPVAITTRAPVTARVASWNTLFSNSTGRVLDGLETIAGTADVIGVQELSSPSRRADAARVMAKKGWAVSDGNNAVQIFYNAGKYKLLAQGSEKVIDVVRIESGTAGTSIGPKSVQWVQLQDRATGGVFFVVNHHLVPDIDRKGHPRPGAPEAALGVPDADGRDAVGGDEAPPLRAGHGHRRPQRRRPRRPEGQEPDLPVHADAQRRDGLQLVSARRPEGGTQTSGRRLIDYVWLTRVPGPVPRPEDPRRLRLRPPRRRRRHRQPLPQRRQPETHASAVAQPSQAALPGQSHRARLEARRRADQDRRHRHRGRQGVQHPRAGLDRRHRRRRCRSPGSATSPAATATPSAWQQQRPSSGWGTVAQIRDIRLATMAFYGVADPHQQPRPDRHRRLAADVDRRSRPGRPGQRLPRPPTPSTRPRPAPSSRSSPALVDGSGAGTGSGDACPGQATGRVDRQLPGQRPGGREGPHPRRPAGAAVRAAAVPHHHRHRRRPRRRAARPPVRPGRRPHDPRATRPRPGRPSAGRSRGGCKPTSVSSAWST